MSERKDLARRLLMEKAILDELQDRNAEARKRIAKEFDPGDRESAIDGEHKLGFVRLDNGRKSASVADDEAILEWFTENRPEEVETVTQTRIRPATLKAILDAAKKDGEAIDKETGEEIPGVRVKVGAPILVVSPEEPSREYAAFLIGSLMNMIDRGWSDKQIHAPKPDPGLSAAEVEKIKAQVPQVTGKSAEELLLEAYGEDL